MDDFVEVFTFHIGGIYDRDLRGRSSDGKEYSTYPEAESEARAFCRCLMVVNPDMAEVVFKVEKFTRLVRQ